VAEFLQVLGGKAATCHAAPCLGVGTSTKEKVAPVRIWRGT
jgi:hypothetical protein